MGMVQRLKVTEKREKEVSAGTAKQTVWAIKQNKKRLLCWVDSKNYMDAYSLKQKQAAYK
jgi:hypothetical protein